MKETGLRVWRVAILLGIAGMFTMGVSAQTEKVLYSFTNGSDGGYPLGGLVSDGKGNYYGTAQFAGSGNGGVVFELSPNSSAGWTERVIYSFVNGNVDGVFPVGGLVFDSKGNLYGMTSNGGAFFSGTVFELTPSNGTWTEKVLWSFGNGSDGKNPYGDGIVLDAAGNIYGITSGGGVYGSGTVFELLAGTNGAWTEKILHNFQGLNDGGGPIGTAPVLDTAGNLYGVAGAGGAHDYGVLYELSPGSGGAWSEKVLYSFPAAAIGAYPIGTLSLDSLGNLYGVTNYTAFELVRGSNGKWTEKTLHHFAGGADGAGAEAGMVFDSAGNLYGQTSTGGAHHGAVYELSPGTNGVWTEKILHRFAANGSDGYNPQFGATVVIDASGNVFGTTLFGGTSNAGTVFEIQP